jgi:hypothetical protein
LVLRLITKRPTRRRRMTGDCHVRFWGRGLRLTSATRSGRSVFRSLSLFRDPVRVRPPQTNRVLGIKPV